MGPVQKVAQESLGAEGQVLDAGQSAGLAALERCASDWQHYKAQRGGRLARVFIHPPIPRGVYLWGGVGRGKTFLMDAFYQVVRIERKLRVHFHAFMRATHKEMYDLKGVEDPLAEVALRVARRYRLICFDEFHISDIADAMILQRLLQALVDARVGFVMTSNYPPSGLYPDGLHRDRLLPAIDLLERNQEVVGLGPGMDYRRGVMTTEGTGIGNKAAGAKGDQDWLTPELLKSKGFYQVSPNGEVSQALKELFDCAAESSIEEHGSLEIEGREVPFEKKSGAAIWFKASTLLYGPRSMHDYLWLAERYSFILLEDLEPLSSAQFSEARRLTWLIDILYDHRVRLAVSARTDPASLYTQGPLSGEFERTVSRLTEMRTERYLQLGHRATLSQF
jgi:cell division protein ZapE